MNGVIPMVYYSFTVRVLFTVIKFMKSGMCSLCKSVEWLEALSVMQGEFRDLLRMHLMMKINQSVML